MLARDQQLSMGLGKDREGCEDTHSALLGKAPIWGPLAKQRPMPQRPTMLPKRPAIAKELGWRQTPNLHTMKRATTPQARNCS